MARQKKRSHKKNKQKLSKLEKILLVTAILNLFAAVIELIEKLL